MRIANIIWKNLAVGFLKKLFIAALFALMLNQNCDAAETTAAASLDGTQWTVFGPQLITPLVIRLGFYNGYAWCCSFQEVCDRMDSQYDATTLWSYDDEGNKVNRGRTLPALGIGYIIDEYRKFGPVIYPMVKRRGEFVPTCSCAGGTWYTLRDEDNSSSRIWLGQDVANCPDEGPCGCASHFPDE
jgi:hypothetical protein